MKKEKRTPAKDQEVFEEWQEIKEALEKETELSETKIHQKIADQYSVHKSTIRYWLKPQQRRNTRKLSASNYDDRWDKEHGREYNRAYKWFTRHLLEYLDEAFDDRKELSLRDLALELAKAAEKDEKVDREIEMRPSTLKRHLERYEDRLGDEFPLLEKEEGVYTMR